MSALIPRAFLRSFSSRASRFPIETIVVAFVLITLAYFQILHSIKHSDFLSGGITNPLSSLRPSVTRRVADKWIPATEEAWADSNYPRSTKVELIQIYFSLEAPFKVIRGGRLSPSFPNLSLHSNDPLEAHNIADSIQSLTRYITLELKTSNGFTYPSLCYKAPGSSDCFSWVHQSGDTQTLTLVFAPSTSERFVHAFHTLKQRTSLQGVKLEIIGKEEKIGEMQSGKWVAYALRALVMRFWDLAKVR